MRDPGVRKQHRAELQVGALVIISAVALVAGMLWITGADLGANAFRVHAMTENAAQVTSGSRVFLHGVDIGSVESVGIADGGAHLALEIDPPRPIPRDSRALIQASGFLGDQMVRILPGQAGQALMPGDTIRAATAPDLQAMASDIGEDAENVLERTQRLLSEETVSDLRQSTSSLSAAMRELESLAVSQREEIDALVTNLQRTSRHLADATEGPEMENTLAQLDSLTARLSETGAVLERSTRSLASILEKVDRGRGTLGQLVNDDRLYEQMTAAVADIQTASEEIGLLTQDIRERPARYLNEMSFSVF